MDFPLPEIGEGVYEAELVRWLVRPGTPVRPGQGLFEVLTDKATMEVPAPFAGTVTGHSIEPGHKVKVGQVVLTYESADVPAPIAARSASILNKPINGHPTPATFVRSSTSGPPVAAPSVRHLARKLGVDLRHVQGSGPAGRILLDDLTAFLKPTPFIDEPRPPRTPPPLDFGIAGTRVKFAGLRRKIAEHLGHSKRVIPDYTYIDECDLTELVRLRGNLRDPFARQGVKLTYLAFFVKAVVAALKEVPLVNSYLDEPAGEIVLHDRYHIGVAVATPGGLIVPVIRDVDRKDLATIANEIERLSQDARTGQSKLDDLRGGTFTITSIGNIGGIISTPIINHPEVGILGIGKVVKRPVYDAQGNLRPADMVYLSLSFDHRVVDGAVAVAFGNTLVKTLQNPAVLLLPEKLR